METLILMTQLPPYLLSNLELIWISLWIPIWLTWPLLLLSPLMHLVSPFNPLNSNLQNGQTHSNNSLAVANKLCECVWPFLEVSTKAWVLLFGASFGEQWTWTFIYTITALQYTFKQILLSRFLKGLISVLVFKNVANGYINKSTTM